jgi:geranylgeranyl pyrophosphate synthase
VEAVTHFGEQLGMSFQIVDDLLGYTGDDRVVGKPLSSDLANARVTLPVIYAIETGGERTRARISALFQADEAHRAQAHHDLIQLLADQGALTRTRARARWYTASAKHQLDRLPETPARERLRALADAFLARDH